MESHFLSIANPNIRRAFFCKYSSFLYKCVCYVHLLTFSYHPLCLLPKSFSPSIYLYFIERIICVFSQIHVLDSEETRRRALRHGLGLRRREWILERAESSLSLCLTRCLDSLPEKFLRFSRRRSKTYHPRCLHWRVSPKLLLYLWHIFLLSGIIFNTN